MTVPETAVAADMTPPFSATVPEAPLPDAPLTSPTAAELPERRAWLREMLGTASSRLARAALGPELVAEAAAARQAAAEHHAPQEYSRRDFLKLSSRAAAVVGGTVLAAQAYETAEFVDQSLTALDAYETRLWPNNKPTFNYLSSETIANPKALAIFFPGFNDTHAAAEAQAVKDQGQLPADVSVGYLDYSNQGATITELAEAIRSQVNLEQLESLTLVCRSMGGPFALGVAKELGIPVKNIIFSASPYEVSDGDYGEAGLAIAKLPSNRALATSTKAAVSWWRAATKHAYSNPFHDFGRSFIDLFRLSDTPLATMEAAAQDFTQGFSDLQTSFDQAAHDTFSNGSPWADGAELRTWDSEQLPTNIHSLSRQERAAYQKAFVPGYTKVLYTATNRPSTDSTVMVRRSAEHFRQFFVDMLGLPEDDFAAIGIPYDGHANIQATMTHIQPWLAQNIKPPARRKILATGPIN